MTTTLDLKAFRRRFWQTLQAKLILPLAFLFIPTLLIQAYVYKERFKALRAEQLQANLEIARAAAKAFDSFVQDVLHLELSIGLAFTSSQTLSDEDKNGIQALQDFASIAAHDMKEPLRKVISFGNMLRQKCGDSLEQSGNDYLNRMLHATERMQSLLTGLLDYSRVATASEPFKQVDLSEIIGEVLSDLEVSIVKTGGKAHVGNLPIISADSTQMRQLFQNLIGNGLKFHKPGENPLVKVHRDATTDACQIIIEDNGIGFSEQYLDKIFAPFQRLHGKSSPYEGTGMGLAICRKIVERHGGSITARSTPDVGSTFIVTLSVPPGRDTN
jgi:light-regulated signal transduction histidine kinase (bacteriophytochrome)